MGLLGQLRPHADRRHDPERDPARRRARRNSSPCSRNHGAGGPRRPTRRPSSSRVRRDDRPDQILLHPMGTLTVQQGVVPLNLQRDIDRIGAAAPERRPPVRGDRRPRSEPPARRPARSATSSRRRSSSTSATTSGWPRRRSRRWTRASRSARTATRSRADRVVRSPFDYTDITIGPDGTATVEPDPVELDGPLVLVLAGLRGRRAGASPPQAAARFAAGPSVRRAGAARAGMGGRRDGVGGRARSGDDVGRGERAAARHDRARLERRDGAERGRRVRSSCRTTPTPT